MKSKSIYVVIDASSYINLSAIEYAFGTLLNMLAKQVIIQVSSTVNQEIVRHSTSNIPDSLRRSSQIHYPEKYNRVQYEQRLFDQIGLTERNRGEKDNFAIALDLFIIKRKSILIFLTDDDIALDGILDEVKNAFPIVKIWNSFDVILFLYFLNKKLFPLEMAQRALNDLHKQTIPASDPNMNREKMREKLKRQSRYFKYLDRVAKLHQEN